MEIWLELTNLKTPDELAKVENIDKTRGIIAEGLREKHHRAVRSIMMRTCNLNRFWFYNGRQVKETYGGIPDHLSRIIRALRRAR